MAKFKMPQRRDNDGPISVEVLRSDRDMLCVSCGYDSLILSRYNAVRLMAMLSVMLDVPIDKTVAKEIRI